jgi:flagellar M-ring protein FliF
MDKSILDIGRQLSAVFKSLSAGKLATLSLLVVATIWGLVSVVQWSGKADYMPLYAKLSAEDAGAVVARLRDQKIPYKLSHDGGTINIPQVRLYEVRLDMATEGLPRGNSVGFEVFDNTKLGVTEFVQNINYQRALQGELSRTINGLEEVESSRVHIVMMPRSLFIEDEDPATASVILKFNNGRWLTQAQVQGVVHLVSSSVPRLSPENVTIVDQSGKLLAGHEDPLSASKISTDQLDFQNRKERLLEKRVLSMLETVVGKGKAIVRVATTLDFVQLEKSEEKYLPENQVVRSEQISSENSSQGTSKPQGVPGMASNVGKYSASKANATDASNQFQKSDNTRNYEIGKMTSHQIMPVGMLKQLSVAAVVDGTYETVVTGKGNKERKEIKYVQRSAEEMAKLENLVKRAVNFDVARGDKVEVTNFAFDTSHLTDVPEVSGMNRWAAQIKAYSGYIKYITVGIFILCTFMFVIRPLMRWLTDTSWEDVELLEHLPSTVAELENKYRQDDANRSPLVSQAANLIQTDRGQTSKVMQQWLNER